MAGPGPLATLDDALSIHRAGRAHAVDRTWSEMSEGSNLWPRPLCAIGALVTVPANGRIRRLFGLLHAPVIGKKRHPRRREAGFYAPRAPRTRSGANGNSRRRTPVSAATALPTAQATTGTPSSPAPVGGLSVDPTLTSILGTSDIRATS